MRYDRSYVMGLAHVIYRRERGRLSWSDALRQAWATAKMIDARKAA